MKVSLNSLFTIVILVGILNNANSLHTQCGGVLEGEHGVIKTPNFPGQFPTPIDCAWVIRNPHPDKKIILYFTQYFLKNSFHLWEYDEYQSEHEYRGSKYLGEMNYINEFSSMVAYKPFLVIRFKVHDIGNMHLRVEEFLKDVYGFNITYEVVGQRQKIKEACSAHDCSFLGHCVANSDYSNYTCQCFRNFFGDYCQYGPFCDPEQGKNMCENDGRCRYFMGSLVNVCDCAPGYTGELCQERNIINQPVENDCHLGCSYDCDQSEDGQYFCICADGFRLDEDNITCIEKEMYRISVQFPLIDVALSSSLIDRVIRNILKSFLLIKKLRIMGLTTATRFQYDQIRNEGNSPTKIMLFHFYVEAVELPLVNSTIFGMLTHGRFLKFRIDLPNIHYTIDPELKLLHVENYDQRPAVEGKLLTIACTARGSTDLMFRWYKDSALVNVSLSDRNAWEVRIPRTMKDKQMSVLNIDGVTVYDKGEFTCSIADFGQVQNKSVMVDVITYPHIEVTPLAVSVEMGQQIGFRCVTPDDTRQTFDYRWFKNGVEIISDHGDEIIEDLIPAGSRLAVRKVTSDANYTCYIKNSAGISNLTAHVFVLPVNKTNQICEADKFEGVRWKKMGSGNFDIERCPTDTGGYSRRSCQCSAGVCLWSQPNFAKCQSGHLVIIYDRLEKLRLGYQHEKLAEIYDALLPFIKLGSSKMLAGDVDVSCYIIHTFIKTLWQFPIHTPTTGMFSYTSLMEALDLLLNQAIQSNFNEQQDLYVAPKLIDISLLLSKIDVPQLRLTEGDSIMMSAIGFKVQNLSVVTESEKQDKLIHQLQQDTFKSVVKRGYFIEHLHNQSEPVNNNTSYKMADNLPKTRLTVQFYFKKMFSLMKDAKRASTPVSDIYSIYLLNNWYSKHETMEIIIQHNIEASPLILNNDTKCVRWNTYRMSFFGYWDDSDCQTISKNLTSTTCWCTVPGTFAVFVQPTQYVEVDNTTFNYDMILLIGCIISLCGLCATIIVYLFTWRQLIGKVHCIHINLVLSLAVVNILCLLCLGSSNKENVCVVVKLLLQFFYLATFAFMFVESVHMFVLVSGGNRIKKTRIKYFLIGWGIPTVSTGSVVIASEKLGYDRKCIDWCWLAEDHWHFYSFLIPMIVLILAQVGLTVVGFITVYKWTEEWRYNDRKKYMYQTAQMIVLQILLTTCCLTGSKILQDAQLYSFLFIISDILLSCFILLFYCVFKRQVPAAILHVFRVARNSDYKRKFSTSSFKAVMMPEKVDERNQEVDEVQDHHNAVNSRKYTRERKQQLRFLVGSSGQYSGSSFSASTSASASGSGSGSDGQVRYPRPKNTDNIDSGFSEETNSDRSVCVKNNGGLMELQPLPVTNELTQTQSQDDNESKQDGYVMADYPVNKTNKDSNSEHNESLIQQTDIKMAKNTHFIFTTDGSSDPLLQKAPSTVR